MEIVALAEEGSIAIPANAGTVKYEEAFLNLDANLTPAESIAGMKAVLDKLTPADNGTFWSYNGSQMPW